MRRPAEPLASGSPSWPEDVERTAERVDRLCGSREAQLLFDYQEGKEEQQRFKTALGSATGAVGTAGGVIGGVGAFVIKDQDTVKTMTGATGFVSAGLGAVGSIVTAVVSPGESKMKASKERLATIDQKRAAARALLATDPAGWSDANREAWTKSAAEMEEVCK